PGSDLSKMMGDIITKTYESRNNAGILFFVGIVTLGFSASNAFETLDKAINRAWNTEKVPSFIVGKLTSFAMILGVLVLLTLSLEISVILSSTYSITKALSGAVH